MNWPRTLVSRHALMLIGVILAGQLLGVSLVSRLIFLPRAEHLAELTARQLEAIQAGLAELPEAQRLGFIERFNRHARPDDRQTDTRNAPWRVLRRQLDADIVKALSKRLTSQQMIVEPWPDHPGNLLVSMPLDGQIYRLVLSEVVPDSSTHGALLTMTAVGILLALASALWLQRRLHRPLARVVAAAEAVVHDERPPLLPEDGPLEIATLSRSFNLLVESLSSAEQERALMLAGISHDLRTPLTNLRLYVELLPADTEADLRDGMERGIDQIDAAIRQFLDFANPGSAEPEQVLQLHELALDVVRQLPDRQQAIQLELPAVTAVCGRPLALQRVISNLLINAWRHGQPPISLHTGECNSDVWIEIRDHGPGITATEARHLRQPFVRGETARSGTPGTGLGLAIVERITRMHGGRLELLPTPGGGLCARVRLPAITPERT
ncbi:ATP-binding protein [Candidatus Thalassolituus haligoni]|uniref:ATP-binding protein n=1 Tax=Candidatus Thalassolituus haligoni TaxID=3100113 RepID=UPI003515DADA|tara:strand:+ start:6374 stop:7693 length:1320 start_codon:yes stop_codon:yes gene_type:complete